MKIAYIMSRFPLLSETFILREMDEVENQGGEIALYPLICQEQDVIHQEAKKWMPRRNCVPFFSLQVLESNLRTILKKPLLYFSLLLKILYWNLPSLKFFLRALILYPKAIYTAEKITAENVSHIHCHYATHPALMAYIIKKFTGISYSITIHSHDIYDCHVMLQQKLEEAEFLVTISQFNVSYLQKLLGDWVLDKINVIHCGINPDNFHTKKEAEIGEKFLILQIGSLHWKKGQTTLIKAIKLLTEKITNFELKIIGEGPERKNLEELIDDLELNDYIQLLGAKSQREVRDILPTADCYVQSSVSEGIPVAIMEALACQIPVLATSITGIPEIIIEQQTGLLVPPNNPQALAKGIFHIYNHYHEALKYAEKGKQLVLNEYNLQRNIKSLVNMFHKLDKQGKI